MSTPPYGPGVTGSAYASYAQKFGEQIVMAGQLFAAHPALRGLEAKITPGHIDIVTIGLPGVMHDWIHALPPIDRVSQEYFPLHCGQGEEDVLKTGIWTVHVRRMTPRGGGTNEALVGVVGQRPLAGEGVPPHGGAS